MGAWRPAGEGKGLPKSTAKSRGGLQREELGWGGAATCQPAVPSAEAARLGFCHVFVYLVWLM